MEQTDEETLEEHDYLVDVMGVVLGLFVGMALGLIVLLAFTVSNFWMGLFIASAILICAGTENKLFVWGNCVGLASVTFLYFWFETGYAMQGLIAGLIFFLLPWAMYFAALLLAKLK